jgi:phenylalanyl-tRNA synthetase beta chain
LRSAWASSVCACGTGVDPQGVDWASRRCCELIQQLAGGTVAPGKAMAGSVPEPRRAITLRLSQIERLLGIAIPRERIRSILTALGNTELQSDASMVVVKPPSWRSDLTREVDLIEEVARIHGYDQIPEDVGVKMAVSTRSREERVLDRVRHTLVAAGFFEALTLSAVEPDWIERFRPWSQAPPLATSTPVLRLANCLRQSLVPSLLAARRHNEKLSNSDADLFEIAKVYLPGSDSALPAEKRVLGLATGRGFLALKGVLEAICEGLDRDSMLETIPTEEPLFAAGQSCRLLLDGKPLGVLGTLSDSGREAFELRDAAAAAEIDLSVLVEAAQLIPQARNLSPYPPVGRDLNIVVDEEVTWGRVAQIVAQTGGTLIEQIRYRDTYRDAERLGKGKKSLLLSLQLRSQEGTLTNEQADAVRAQIVAAIGAEVGGELRA